ncbi:amino acid adenylation domain-containing protein [[Kitasatospora] papulosa]|uniref:non-ribosomal peptide synthetase n=1 Tax=[Kitasatospora] papulosa TaxID=1464011 RepID=UPI003677ED0B
MTPHPEGPHRYPMSGEQESIWLNDQFQEGSHRYVESWVHRLRGSVDTVAVEAALSGIVARHEPLRSALVMEDGRAVQIVHPPGPVPLDLREVAPDDLADAVRRAVSGSLPTDRPPLLRATLLRTGAHEAVLAVALHHAVVDGWSLRLLDEEFSELYRATVEGRLPELPELPLTFGAYATGRQRAAAEDDGAMAYWRREMDGAPAESTFPLDRPRPQAADPGGGLVEFDIGPDLAAAVRRACRLLRATPFVLLTAALAALVARLAGQDDIVLGTPVSRRDHEELESLIACLTDVMPLRLRPRPGGTFRDLVAASGAAVRGAMTHRDVPYGRLVREFAGERRPSTFPLFQVVFAIDDARAPGLSLPGVAAERLHTHDGTAKFDVFLHLVPHDGGYRGRLEYATGVLDRDTARRLTERYLTLVADAVRHPARILSDLAVMPGAEALLVTEEFGRGPESAKDRPLAHEAVARTAERLRHGLAVVDGERRLTYGELWTAAGYLARRLVARGLAGGRVAIRLGRSADFVIAVLAVLRAGGACVPLDPALPAERTDFMLRDSGVNALLTTREPTACPAPHPSGVVTFFLEDAPAPDRTAVASATLPSVSSEDLAYVVYTSGSTGRPKGVAMPHRALASLVAWQCASSNASVATPTLQFAPVGFDVAFQEIFSTWSSGGTLVLAPGTARSDPALLLDLLDRHAVARLYLPYVALQQLAGYAVATGRRAAGLREVITAGEELHVTPVIREFFAACPRARLENQYGPSETHVVTTHRLTGPPEDWPDRPPIGRPVPGSRVRVLDERLRPRPIGAVGEICVSGDGVALGYLAGEAADTRRFTPDPFAPMGEGLLYRTGDLGRFTTDGTIQFLGRTDDQVKIRGYRVEPGEVEAALKAVSGVTDAVVVVGGADAEERRLEAYFTGTVEPHHLLRGLRDRLPAHMVPRTPVRVSSLPRTASGKADRAAVRRLHAPAVRGPQVGPARQGDLRSPHSGADDVERSAAAVWSDVLRTDRTGPDDDFFSLGGDSLLAVRLAVRLRTELGLDVHPSDVFRAPTLASLISLVHGVPGAAPTAGLASRAALPPGIRPAAVVLPATADPRHVLLTGATGFLGVFLLRDLLEHTRATVHCLVRARDEEEARRRLRHQLERYGLWRTHHEKRIRPLVGDLAAPGLGLGPRAFDRLARTVDVVFHSGAAVNLVHSYDRLRAANVEGTAEVLRLAASHRTVPLHHVSTVGVFPPGLRSPSRVPATHSLGSGALLRHGYAQTKWVAETLVAEARKRGLPVTVYRPTRISGDSATGLCQTSDFLWLLVKGCLQAGMAPGDYDSHFDLVPVDHVSGAIRALSADPSAAGRVFHLSSEHHLPFPEITARLRALGYHLDDVSLESWHRRLEQDEGNAAFPLLGLLPRTGPAPSEKGTGSAVFESDATRRALRGSGVARAEVDEVLFARYVTSFVNDGFLPPPLRPPGSRHAEPSASGHPRVRGGAHLP